MPGTLIYDAHCPFCRRWALRLQRFAGADRLQIAAMDAPGTMDLHPNFDYSRAVRAVQLILENGYLCEGAEAAMNAVALRPGFGFLKYFYYVPLFRQAADLFYAIIARNRNRCESCP
jgi:predicted DCC family thiol-disulfide oxidoreductase YuxK